MSELKMVVSFRPGGWHEMTILGEPGSVRFVIALYLGHVDKLLNHSRAATM